jgi:hypothetical protein
MRKLARKKGTLRKRILARKQKLLQKQVTVKKPRHTQRPKLIMVKRQRMDTRKKRVIRVVMETNFPLSRNYSAKRANF